MEGGEILVHGDAGEEVGAGLRRGLIAVAGRVGAAAGLSALAGTIVAFGAVGAHPGAGMRRASIIAMTSPTLLPTYASACTYRPPFLRLCLRRLRALGLPVTDAQIEARYTRWSGDAVELRRAEILILEPPP
jgi:formylmethanofuran dehydrogenase subunit C